MKSIITLVKEFEKRNNMSVAFTMYGDESWSVNEFYDNDQLANGKDIKELKTFLSETEYKKDANGRTLNPCVKVGLKEQSMKNLNHIKWWRSLPEIDKWNLTINHIKHWSKLDDSEILKIYSLHNI